MLGLVSFLNKSRAAKRIRERIGIATTKKILDAAKEENNVFPKMKFAKGIAKIKLISSPIHEATRLITSAKPTMKTIGFQTLRTVPIARLSVFPIVEIHFLRVPLVFLFSPEVFFLTLDLNRTQSLLQRNFQSRFRLFFQC